MGDSFRLQDAVNGDAGQAACDQFAAGDWVAVWAGDLNGGFPGAVVKAWVLPSRRLFAGIEIFTTVNRGECDRTGHRLPTLVADKCLLAAICIGDMHLKDELGLTEGADELGIASGHPWNVVHAIPQEHRKAVDAW